MKGDNKDPLQPNQSKSTPTRGEIDAIHKTENATSFNQTMMTVTAKTKANSKESVLSPVSAAGGKPRSVPVFFKDSSHTDKFDDDRRVETDPEVRYRR